MSTLKPSADSTKMNLRSTPQAMDCPLDPGIGCNAIAAVLGLSQIALEDCQFN
jgi:hypothetical protein